MKDKMGLLATGNWQEMLLSKSKENIVLIDSSKFERSGNMNLATLDRIDILVTDNNILLDRIHYLEESGIKVILAND